MFVLFFPSFIHRFFFFLFFFFAFIFFNFLFFPFLDFGCSKSDFFLPQLLHDFLSHFSSTNHFLSCLGE